MKLELSSLTNAVDTLEKSIGAMEEFAATLPAAARETMRSGVIQNFEVAYKQCWKMMQRWLETNVSPTTADGVTRRELFRLAAENLLIDDVNLWMEFHVARNETAHVYDRDTAAMVSGVAEQFLTAAKKFLVNLQARND
ncbi:MAG: nucleotidyltransferase substrate binding protein [Verrucomicrobiales bacterium]|jgi:nucleotidyltransferase substrate binding protein (TIGR01987 family)|nr:nucleotidyltransferase substrate binding protein [Verrucomicrobiales bacterium]